MKRIIFTLLAATGLMSVSGQNLNKIKESIAANKITEAKTAIETLLTNPKNQKIQSYTTSKEKCSVPFQ